MEDKKLHTVDAVLIKLPSQYGKSNYIEPQSVHTVTNSREDYVAYLEKQVTNTNKKLGNCYHLIYILSVVIIVTWILK